MNKATREIDFDVKCLNIKSENVEIKGTESSEINLSEQDSLQNGNFSHEGQNFLIEDEMMNEVFVKEEPLDFIAYEKVNEDHKCENVGIPSTKQESSIFGDKMDKMMSSTYEGKKFSARKFEAGELKVSNTKKEYINKVKIKNKLIGTNGTNRKHTLKDHLSKLETKKFKSSKCSLRTKFEGNLKSHLLKHADAKLFKCSECNYKTSRKHYLKTHLLKHAGTLMFTCSDCNYGTNWKGNLKLHLLSHSETHLFNCSDCNYKTNRKHYLKTHLLKHTGTMMFTCSECNYGTNWKGNLKLHLLKHSKTKLLQCSECNYKTNIQTNLKTHLSTHLKKNEKLNVIVTMKLNKKPL